MLNTPAARGFAIYQILLISHTIYSNPHCFCHHCHSHPHQPCCRSPLDGNNTERLVVTLKVFDPNLLRQEYSLNLTVTNVVGSEIMHKHDHLNDQPAKCGVTWKASFAVRECTLQSAHTPLTCLPKRCVTLEMQRR
jgi:hypothetical protein